MNNPYESPQGANVPPAAPSITQGSPGGRLGDASMVRQVKIVCILSLVQAGIEILMGVMLLFMGPLLSNFVGAAAKNDPNPPPEEFLSLISTFYMVMGLVAIIVAVVRIPAAVLNLSYKARGLGIASAIVGVAAVFSGYCGLTAIGLTVYGLVVLLNPDVKRAFELAKQGYSREQILNAPRFE